jgi:UDP-2,4-diacetamido-2,4,6-trideoxy-beta-L-altropyranose hydrolase
MAGVMKELVIRADASTQMGTGHLMRCLALGQGWKDAGGEVIFVTSCQNEGLLKRLSEEGFILHKMTKPHPDPGDWNYTKVILANYADAWVVLDGYHFDEVYQQRVKETGYRLLVIDDLANLKHYYADIVLNQNLHAEQKHYACEPDTYMLLGSRYVLLRREFLECKGCQREIPETAKRVLVTLGGSDPGNYTLKIIQALQEIYIPDIEATVVVGASNPHFGSLESASMQSRIPIRLIRDANNMKDLLVWADMAISTAGTTIWELLFLGTPSLLVVAADNQSYSAEQVEKHGAGKNLGWIKILSKSALVESITTLLKDYDLRVNMSSVSRQLVDGRGVQRVLNFMQNKAGLKLSLRPVTLADCCLLWEWANNPTVRAASFSSKPISWEEHQEWFNKQLSNLDCYYYIIVKDMTIPIGQVRFDKSGNAAEISISISEIFRGHGYSAEAIIMASKYLFQESDISRIYARIKPGNTASISAFARAGYNMGKNIIVKGHEAFEMILNREEVLVG